MQKIIVMIVWYYEQYKNNTILKPDLCELGRIVMASVKNINLWYKKHSRQSTVHCDTYLEVGHLFTFEIESVSNTYGDMIVGS